MHNHIICSSLWLCIGGSRLLQRVAQLPGCHRSSSAAHQCPPHRCFFWKKSHSSHSVVRPAVVRPSYAVPKVITATTSDTYNLMLITLEKELIFELYASQMFFIYCILSSLSTSRSLTMCHPAKCLSGQNT